MWKIVMEDDGYNRIEFSFNDLTEATKFVEVAISKNSKIKVKLELEDVDKDGDSE